MNNANFSFLQMSIYWNICLANPSYILFPCKMSDDSYCLNGNRAGNLDRQVYLFIVKTIPLSQN